MPVPEPLELALEVLKSASAEDVRLYVVKRVLKDGLRARSRVANKYEYLPLRASANGDALMDLLTGICGHVEASVSGDDLEVKGYELVEADDVEALYTYPQADLEHLSFARSIEAIRGDTSLIEKTDWEALALESLHGYALSVSIGDMDVLLFNRLRSQNVHQPLTPKSRLFGISGDELRPVTKTVLSFDIRVSCLLVNGSLFILSKKQFEDLVGFTEELRRGAEQVVDELERIDLLSGLDVLRAELHTSSLLLRRLAALSKKGHLDTMSPGRIEKMKKMAADYGLKLPLDESGRLVITSRKDIQNVIKWLSDNFVVSPQTDNLYDSSVKSQIVSS